MSPTLEPGYHEMTRNDEIYPMVTLSVTEALAVVHYFSEDACYILQGDGVVSEDIHLDFEILDVPCAFSGEFICSARRAQHIVDQFMGGVDPDDLGEWIQT